MGQKANCVTIEEMKTKILLAHLGCIILVTSCSPLKKVDELKTLKDIAREQGEIDAFVREQDEKFDAMLAAYHGGELSRIPDTRALIDQFGVPVIVLPVEDGNGVSERWVYRRQIKYFNSDKIYVDVDESGRIKDFEYVAAVNKNEGS